MRMLTATRISTMVKAADRGRIKVNSPSPPTADELRCSRENGLLSPALSSKRGEGEDHERTWAKCLNSMAVPSPPGRGRLLELIVGKKIFILESRSRRRQRRGPEAIRAEIAGSI